MGGSGLSIDPMWSGMPPPSWWLLEQINSVVNLLFQVGVTLDGTARSASDDRLEAATAILDQAVHNLRSLAFGLARDAAATEPPTTHDLLDPAAFASTADLSGVL